MGCQVTASKTDLFLTCRRPFASGTEVVRVGPTEAMRYGSCIHALLEAALTRGAPSPHTLQETCTKWGVDDLEGARKHLDTAWAALQAWMRPTGNPWGVAFSVVAVECPEATRLLGGTPRRPPRTRDCAFNAPAHHYDLQDGEVGGTADVVLFAAGWGYVIVDLKTGDYGDWTQPAQLGQMRTLVMQSRYRRQSHKGKWGAAILHSPRDGVTLMHAEEVTQVETRAHLAAMQDAMRRTEDGSMTPGPHCARCPAREGCPTQDGSLLARAGGLMRVGTAELLGEAVDPGRAHMMLQQFDVLAKRLREALREEVRRGVVINRPDGKTLALVEKTIEGLSKSSIVRALGKEEGEVLIAELRAKGCTEVRVQEELRAVDGDK